MREGVSSHGTIRRLRRAAFVRALAVLAAALPVVASLSFSRHETAVQHVRCAEHGELTHVAAARLEAPAAPDTSVRNARAAGPLEARSAGAHEHCGELSDCLGTEASCVHGTAVRAPLPAVEPRVVASPPRSSRAVVLAAAPKTSPPRAG